MHGRVTETREKPNCRKTITARGKRRRHRRRTARIRLRSTDLTLVRTIFVFFIFYLLSFIQTEMSRVRPTEVHLIITIFFGKRIIYQIYLVYIERT